LRPSIRGFFDLHGNLFEWTHDWYGDFGETAAVDSLGAKEGSNRVSRGGGWIRDAANCRSALRSSGDPTIRTISLGFRLALSPSGVSPEAASVKGAEPSGAGTEGASAEQRPEMP
jgi:formylglycine-generating enzyme